MASASPEKTAAATTTEIPNESANSSQNGGYFPWLEEEKDRNFSSKLMRRFPVLGALGLVGSGMTCLLSWMTLYFFSGHEVIEGGYLPKPAAWLSVILSLNSILAHMAVSQGVAVGWWYRASRKGATVEELHNVWATGSSIGAALTTWKAFNYIALATVFVGTLPINGILLQNAMTSGVNYHQVNRTANFSIATSLPEGFSADLSVDGSVGTYSSLWQTAIPEVIGNVDQFYKSTNPLNTCKGDCSGIVEAVGFQVEDVCPTYTIPYNLPTDTTSNSTQDSTMFSVDITWNSSTPYTMGLNTLVKDSTDCSGFYTVTNCTLHMAKVTYPVWVKYNKSGDESWTWYNRMGWESPSHPWSYYYPNEIVEVYPEVPETNQTAFGGIASALQAFYGSSVVMHPTRNGTTLKYNGLFAQQLQTRPLPGPPDEFGNLLPAPTQDRCNISFTSFLPYGNPRDFMLSKIRDTLFYTSIYQALQDRTSYQKIDQTPDWISTNEYHVLWKFWAGSVAVTLAIILFILPTFWGFWTLARKTTLSPLETARAFHAPVLREAPGHMDTPGLLKEVGKNNIHTDMLPNGGAPARRDM
ncbi:hypothetical protein VTL71DRAFT_12269 [Oculimacula yallundae]|uniref:Uncharacterized protein n=1 Tax=Oculimacula yallundae TaxID=86028 RepID=A0ABR4CM63_9HELO